MDSSSLALLRNNAQHGLSSNIERVRQNSLRLFLRM
jgi:hypothetical protein